MQKIVSDSECRGILFKFLPDLKAQFIKYDIQLIKNSDVIGFMGEYYQLRIHYEIEDQLKFVNFFVKTIPLTNAYHRQEIEEKGFFQKEVGIYENILGKLQLFCKLKHFPNCYYSRSDLIVLENLNNENYQNLAKSQIYTMDLFKTVVNSLASIHTASILYEHKTGVNIGEMYGKYLEEVQVNPDNNWYSTGLLAIKAVALIHPKYQNPAILKFLNENLMDRLEKAHLLANTSDKFRNVFCHRDAWDRNILFKYDTKTGESINCVFVDYQLSRYSPPAIDVLFTIYLNTNQELRSVLMAPVLRYYHYCLMAKLQESGIPQTEQIDWPEFVESCNYVKFIVLVLKAICAPLTHLPTEWSENIRMTDPEKFSYYMTCNRDEMILNLMNEYEDYKNVILESVAEVVDYIL